MPDGLLTDFLAGEDVGSLADQGLRTAASQAVGGAVDTAQGVPIDQVRQFSETLRGPLRTIKSRAFSDRTRLGQLNNFLSRIKDSAPDMGIQDFTIDQFLANEQLLTKSAGQILQQMDLLDKNELAPEDLFKSIDDVFQDVISNVDLQASTKFKVREGTGEGRVQEFTGDTLTKDTVIRSRGEKIAPDVPGTFTAKAGTAQTLRRFTQAEVLQRAEKDTGRRIDLYDLGDSSMFRDFLNARFSLQQEAIATRDGVIPKLVDEFVRNEMQATGDDPENIFAGLMNGALRVPSKLTEASIKVYTDQGRSRGEVIKRFNTKFGGTDAPTQ